MNFENCQPAQMGASQSEQNDVPQVTSHLHYLNLEVEVLQKTIDQLEKRLIMVLHPVLQPQEKINKEGCPIPAVPLARGIAETAQKIKALKGIVEMINKRLAI